MTKKAKNTYKFSYLFAYNFLKNKKISLILAIYGHNNGIKALFSFSTLFEPSFYPKNIPNSLINDRKIPKI